MHIPRVVCSNCEREMEPHQNGVVVESLVPYALTDDLPYYKIQADEYKCPNCNNKIITGFANKPIVEHFDPAYKNVKTDRKIFLY